MVSYLSTRGEAPTLDFKQAVLAGLAPDGGLYLPDHVPVFSAKFIVALKELSYPELAVKIMTPFTGGIAPDVLKKLVEASYKSFSDPDIAPLTQLKENFYLLELFHGPTLAFKDFALQFLGRLLDHIVQEQGGRIVIVGATSGDTGSAAIAGCRGRPNMDIYILHPKGRVSDVQRRQMTTVVDENVHNIAIEGTFDDCQDIVKALFADGKFRAKHHLTAVNSINWARILAQVVYYFYAALKLGAPEQKVSFTVPTGNFGDIYAGYVAKKMGLPVERLVIATNQNDILVRTLQTGTYGADAVLPSFSPSMDIQVSSNFERLLFDLCGRNGKEVAALMQRFKSDKKFTLSKGALATFQRDFAAGSAGDEETLTAIRDIYESTGELLDPHSAVGVHVAQEHLGDVPMVALATAHPAKFPDAVKEATGLTPALPEHLQNILQLPERYETLANDVSGVQGFINRLQGTP